MTSSTPSEASDAETSRKTVLNVGCGRLQDPRLAEAFPAPAWAEVRLDIDPLAEPDILASMIDMAVVPAESIDAIWSSHNLEHLFHHEVPLAYAEFLRVLKPGGVLVAAVPDLQAIAAAVAEGNLEEPLYDSDAGPVSARDVIYGFTPAVAAGYHHMVHRNGFTAKTLGEGLQAAGFEPVFVRRIGIAYELWVEAYRPGASPETPAS